MLGNLYVRGIGVDKDLAKAVDLFQKSAAQNNPHACASLGRAYEKGVGGLPQDTAQAIEWYRKAGDEPHAKEALVRLNAQ
jgi:TPR repeat protein